MARFLISVIRFFQTVERGMFELDMWWRGDAPKPRWLTRRKPKHFENFDDIIRDYIECLPTDEARREFMSQHNIPSDFYKPKG